MTTVEEKLKKIIDLKQNLSIFNREYIKLRVNANKAIDDSFASINSEYYYNKFLMLQLKKYKEAQKSPETNDLTDQKNNLKEIYNSYKNLKNQNILNNANEAILNESYARDLLLNCQSDLIGALLELNEHQDDSVINEIDNLIKN
jgi:hypothetical protein